MMHCGSFHQCSNMIKMYSREISISSGFMHLPVQSWGIFEGAGIQYQWGSSCRAPNQNMAIPRAVRSAVCQTRSLNQYLPSTLCQAFSMRPGVWGTARYKH